MVFWLFGVPLGAPPYDKRLVPGLKNMPVPVLVTLKFRYTNRTAPMKRPFLLAGELASPVGRVLVVLG